MLSFDLLHGVHVIQLVAIRPSDNHVTGVEPNVDRSLHVGNLHYTE